VRRGGWGVGGSCKIDLPAARGRCHPGLRRRRRGLRRRSEGEKKMRPERLNESRLKFSSGKV
jgi:hypothetical protein